MKLTGLFAFIPPPSLVWTRLIPLKHEEKVNLSRVTPNTVANKTYSLGYREYSLVDSGSDSSSYIKIQSNPIPSLTVAVESLATPSIYGVSSGIAIAHMRHQVDVSSVPNNRTASILSFRYFLYRHRVFLYRKLFLKCG